jgi:hypothetical protein
MEIDPKRLTQTEGLPNRVAHRGVLRHLNRFFFTLAVAQIDHRARPMILTGKDGSRCCGTPQSLGVAVMPGTRKPTPGSRASAEGPRRRSIQRNESSDRRLRGSLVQGTSCGGYVCCLMEVLRM